MTPSNQDLPASGVVEQLFAKPEKVRQYVDILTNQGVDRGLVGPREAERIWARHILNCAVIAPAFDGFADVCDLGSGAGLPGLVLALARPALAVTLVEPMQRRVTFLTEVVARLELENVEVLRARAAELHGRATFDAVTARAVAPLDRLAAWGLPLLRASGVLLAMKGSRAADEVRAARGALSRHGAGQVRIDHFGAGVVDPPTTLVRIESGRAKA